MRDYSFVGRYAFGMTAIQSDARTFPIPQNEKERLRELHDLELIGAESIESIDRICALARDLFKVPIALVTLLDRNRQYFLASCGVGAGGTARKDAFCNYTILSDAVFVVRDATADPRFADNPLVTGPPHIRFYAGASLTVRPGINLGSLCLIDSQPRAFSESDAAHLSALADVIVSEIRGRRDANTLMRRKKLLRQTAHMSKIGGWEIHYPLGKLIWDDEIYHMFGIPPDTVPDAELILDRYHGEYRADSRRRFKALFEKGIPYDIELPATRRNGDEFWVRAIGESEIVDGKLVHVFGAVQDITERKAAEARIYDLAYNDPLTGLPNRARFQDKLKEAIGLSEKTKTEFGLLMLDVDHFKDVNDTLGHPAGDKLLSTVAERRADVFAPMTPWRASAATSSRRSFWT